MDDGKKPWPLCQRWLWTAANISIIYMILTYSISCWKAMFKMYGFATAAVWALQCWRCNQPTRSKEKSTAKSKRFPGLTHLFFLYPWKMSVLTINQPPRCLVIYVEQSPYSYSCKNSDQSAGLDPDQVSQGHSVRGHQVYEHFHKLIWSDHPLLFF